MGIDRLAVLKAYLDTRSAPTRARSDIETRQANLWRGFAPVIARTPALKPYVGKPLNQLPIVTPKELRESFDHWNTLDLKHDAAHTAATEAERGGAGEVAPGVSAGLSTGTSGARGVFLASRQERAHYLGQALAKLLPWDGLLRPRRIALCLRADSALYRDVGDAGPFRFRFIGLDTPLGEIAQTLSTFAPHILIAPSHILADLARMGYAAPPHLERLFYGAEPMGDDERAWIHHALGVRPDPIYQATEGFLGAACAHGTLHLNEDTLIVERHAVHGVDRFQPIVTDLRRTTQPMVRVLLDDLLEPMHQPCPCGSAHLAVHPVEGRTRDIWRHDAAAIAPRAVTNAIATAIGPHTDWRATATPTAITIATAPDHADAAIHAIAQLIAHHGVHVPVHHTTLTLMHGPKRRQVRWQNG